ncbi:MAG: dienelactone hydrolase family protein [Thalassotalea sp.]|nr:dienelactone hydrolase family protein [Thalassotalea sp.]
MKTIIVTDIFGKTPALEMFAESISLKGGFSIVDPYQGKNVQFANEANAYEYFSQHIGIKKYYQKLEKYLLSINKPYRLVGFSVGAAVCWQYCAKNNSCYLMKSDLFYGSQIRNMQTLEPQSPVNLIMPKSEPHFSIDDHIQALTGKKQVTISKTEYLHGFMNPLSKNYHQQAYQNYLSALVEQ